MLYAVRLTAARRNMVRHFEREREIVETFTRPSHYSQTYDAFETDIAVLYVYFGQPTTTEYIRKRGIFCVK